jgi:outer membrane protein OmpA-like peptidoglycan-associated protein/ElaB/YqjD/DUF883 family membrane-anchored ribosome-binding protein
MNKHFWFILSALLAFLMGACATRQLESIPGQDPVQLVNQLKSDLEQAQNEQVDALAPGLFKEAQAAYVKAQKALDKGAKLMAIKDHVGRGRARLDEALDVAQISRTILSQTNQARTKALKVSAEKLGESFQNVEKQYLKLTGAIENDNLGYAQSKASQVQAAYGELEVMAIKNNALGETRKALAEAERLKYKKIIPKVFDEAQKALQEADDYIGQHPYESATIAQKASHAAFMARRMNIIYETSQKYKEMTPEAIALDTEGVLSKLSESMDVGDLRDKIAENQIGIMADAYQRKLKKIDSLEIIRLQHLKQIQDLEESLAGQEGYSREQEAARRKLAAEREFNQRFIKVQRYFQPHEAEVYKQGDQLVIRLRGIRFPVGQAILTPDNYYLLSKVQKAIRTFNQPTVVIEGHTDSTGSAELNQTLSQDRAAAVKAYLAANNTLPGSRIRSAGFGPDRPLAPNTTEEGRAINRRIDILIKPSQKP